MEGEGAVFAAGGRSPRPLVVQVTDETGGPVSGAAVTFHMPEEGPGGVFANGLRTELAVTDAGGRASVRNLRLNRIPGQFDIRIVAAREQARAGTISSHYISDYGRARGTARPTRTQARSRRKWVAVALLAAGAAGGGLAASLLGGVTQASPSSGPPQVTIGTPAITVGKP